MKYLSDMQQAVLHGEASVDFLNAYWADKVRWAVAGDVTDEGNRVARVNGRHYVLHPMASGRDKTFLGHGGRVMRFRFLDGTEVESNNVWAQGKIPLRLRAGALADNADIMTEDWGDLFAPAPDLPAPDAMTATLRNLSKFEHDTYAVNFQYSNQIDKDGYDETVVNEDRAVVPIEQAQVWSSQIVAGPNAGMHVLALDLDESARLVPTTTPGHYHLIIDKPIGWAPYVAILTAMSDAGLVEPGYVAASVNRGFTSLRLPWIQKRHLDEKQRADRDAHNLAVEDQADPQAGKFLAFNRDGLAMIVDRNPDPVPLTIDEWKSARIDGGSDADPFGF